MILAEKIVRLRKQVGWSQEDLAEKMDVSRQSVSKWESTNSIPDLNKIIKLADLFEVSTDYLLKDEIETSESVGGNSDGNTIQISLEQAMKYVNYKIKESQLIAKGVFLTVGSPIPLITLLAMVKSGQLDFSQGLATAIGVLLILVMISIGVSFFIRTNQFENDVETIDNERFELSYGVHSAFKEKLQKYRSTYNLKLSISIGLFIFSFVPLMFGSMLFSGPQVTLLMLNVLLLMLGVGIFILIPVSAEYEAYNSILQEGDFGTTKSKRTRRAEKMAAFYWPLLVAFYLGWSLWTMDWGITWIVWPVGAILFVALIGLMELFVKEEDK